MVNLDDILIVQKGKKLLSYTFPRLTPADSLKPWTSADIDRFSKEDPVHGNNIKKLRSAGALAGAGGIAGGAVGTAYCFSRGGTLNGSLISAVIGGVSSLAISLLMAQQVTVFTHGLYAFDKAETSQAFRAWWRKNGGAA